MLVLFLFLNLKVSAMYKHTWSFVIDLFCFLSCVKSSYQHTINIFLSLFLFCYNVYKEKKENPKLGLNWMTNEYRIMAALWLPFDNFHRCSFSTKPSICLGFSRMVSRGFLFGHWSSCHFLLLQLDVHSSWTPCSVGSSLPSVQRHGYSYLG